MTLNTDERLLTLTQDVLKAHRAYRRRAHKTVTSSGWLATGSAGVTAANSAEVLAELVDDRKDDLARYLPAQVTRAGFRTARGRLLGQDQAAVRWQFGKVRHPGGTLAATAGPSGLVDLVYEEAATLREVVDATKGLPKKIKDARRDAARDRLAAVLCGLNQAQSAHGNPGVRTDLAVAAATALQTR